MTQLGFQGEQGRPLRLDVCDHSTSINSSTRELKAGNSRTCTRRDDPSWTFLEGRRGGHKTSRLGSCMKAVLALSFLEIWGF